MQRLSQMWSDTLKGLSAFSVRDRLLVGALATIVIMVLVIVAGLTGRTSTVALFPAGTAAQQIADAQAVAAAEGITVEPRSGMLYVAEEQKTRLLARLAEQNRLGSSAALLFDTLATKQNWMNSQRENDRWFLIAKQNELAKVIANFTGIKAAKVSIDVPDNPGMLNAYKRPTAHVTVTATEPLTTKKVNAIAGLVAGATAGLNRSDVRVADTESGQEFKPQAEGDFASSDYLEHVDKVESRIHAKIADALAYVRGAIVTVNAQVDMRKTTTSTNEVLPIKKGAAGSLSTLITDGAAVCPNASRRRYSERRSMPRVRAARVLLPRSSSSTWRIYRRSISSSVISARGEPIATASSLPWVWIFCGRSSTVISSSRHSATARSTQFSSSRTLPGQSYRISSRAAADEMPLTGL